MFIFFIFCISRSTYSLPPKHCMSKLLVTTGFSFDGRVQSTQPKDASARGGRVVELRGRAG